LVISSAYLSFSDEGDVLMRASWEDAGVPWDILDEDGEIDEKLRFQDNVRPSRRMCGYDSLMAA
jgi:hypothetical protein